MWAILFVLFEGSMWKYNYRSFQINYSLFCFFFQKMIFFWIKISLRWFCLTINRRLLIWNNRNWNFIFLNSTIKFSKGNHYQISNQICNAIFFTFSIYTFSPKLIFLRRKAASLESFFISLTEFHQRQIQITKIIERFFSVENTHPIFKRFHSRHSTFEYKFKQKSI